MGSAASAARVCVRLSAQSGLLAHSERWRLHRMRWLTRQQLSFAHTIRPHRQRDLSNLIVESGVIPLEALLRPLLCSSPDRLRLCVYRATLQPAP